HQLGHVFARLLFPLLRPRWWRDHVERECAHRLGASERRERSWIKCALFDWFVDLVKKLLLLAGHDVLLMQRDREQRAIFIAAFVAVKIELLRFVSVVVGVFGLREHKKRKAFFKAGHWQLAFDDFLYCACELLLQFSWRFEASVD